MCSRLGIRNRKSTPYRPLGNSMVERTNGVIKQMAYIDRHSDWDRHLPAICFAMRTSGSELTGFTPASLTFGRELRDLFTVGVSQTRQAESGDTFMDRVGEMVEIARENLKRAAERRGALYDSSRADHVFKVGDRVLRVNNVLGDASLRFSSGLAPAYEGPFVISKYIGTNVFDLVTLDYEPAGRRHADVL
jgi:hypothetical protein